MVSAAAGASKEDDIQKMLKCATHLGTKNCDVLMEPYVFKRRADGMFCVMAMALSRTVWTRVGSRCDAGWRLLRFGAVHVDVVLRHVGAPRRA